MSFFGKLTTRERYGVRLALQLAKTYITKKPISLSEISENEDISIKYLEQLIVPFKTSKYVKSIRGREGGYIMTKNPKTISLKDVMELLDEDLYIIDCLKPKSKRCRHHEGCCSRQAWIKIQSSLINTLNSIKIDDLINKKHETHTTRTKVRL